MFYVMMHSSNKIPRTRVLFGGDDLTPEQISLWPDILHVVTVSRETRCAAYPRLSVGEIVVVMSHKQTYDRSNDEYTKKAFIGLVIGDYGMHVDEYAPSNNVQLIDGTTEVFYSYRLVPLDKVFP